ncbi:hypothetical protein [Oscillatoria sp. FACHB-1406]|uniref:hypothetical protein n=1 Tax=Oscillatoria sp. FACHB-1406 TaxID=2692846 RepID=UPI0016839B48|nr:hypothetical protein [Oscillatoria sp. FACHB-1406]MBD2577214.1 hypothetical protein [Oscillatoria sp. FACHB-1406]
MRLSLAMAREFTHLLASPSIAPGNVQWSHWARFPEIAARSSNSARTQINPTSIECPDPFA